jgi:hypothetical protein
MSGQRWLAWLGPGPAGGSSPGQVFRPLGYGFARLGLSVSPQTALSTPPAFSVVSLPDSVRFGVEGASRAEACRFPAHGFACLGRSPVRESCHAEIRSPVGRGGAWLGIGREGRPAEICCLVVKWGWSRSAVIGKRRGGPPAGREHGYLARPGSESGEMPRGDPSPPRRFRILV